MKTILKLISSAQCAANFNPFQPHFIHGFDFYDLLLIFSSYDSYVYAYVITDDLISKQDLTSLKFSPHQWFW